MVSFSFYMGVAVLAERSLGATPTSSLTSPYGIAIQLAVLIGVVLLARVDWTKYLPAAEGADQ
ncbi:hypothetical protein GCM10011610_35330 [Nocardia rhizosphaerihabitans]|uniref:Uncharacterized protein n=1 Tax=Nocardia rhizosphaerihabitans TaxID=1691570 RepID=A0ABQ2KHL0_9NOCA|nr:hypothetical protein GCM10011610_35330 [Nocardia rhizosphaerihabitans]